MNQLANARRIFRSPQMPLIDSFRHPAAKTQSASYKESTTGPQPDQNVKKDAPRGIKRKRAHTEEEYEGLGSQPCKLRKITSVDEIDGIKSGTHMSTEDVVGSLLAAEMRHLAEKKDTSESTPMAKTKDAAISEAAHATHMCDHPIKDTVQESTTEPPQLSSTISPTTTNDSQVSSNAKSAAIPTAPSLPDLVAHCGHPIHPTYAGGYHHQKCPVCFIESHTSNFASITSYIGNSGGVSKWLENCKDPAKHPETAEWETSQWLRNTRGGCRKNRQNVLRNKEGHDGSYRHCKKRLANLLLDLKTLAAKEAAWIERADYPEDVLERYDTYSAKAALEKYKETEADGLFTYLENLDTAHSRKRGREHEIATFPDYPEDRDDQKITHTYNQKTLSQAIFIMDSSVPGIEYDEIPDANPPKRKRRCVEAKVSFHRDIKICLERDVDVLSQQAIASMSSTDVSKGKAVVPGRSILRTALTSNSSVLAETTSNVYMEPKRPYYTHPVKSLDVYHRPKKRAQRKHPSSIVWPASEGSEIIDTTGT
ncbi:hypothetical protein GQ44DRAFT_824166 [Phaeosphaeriaceae sp. PMI808]|nr:hypothetical protein GQ44DRAFT_824166 [Phaeosphaeriaceae sp. PMI808]